MYKINTVFDLFAVLAPKSFLKNLDTKTVTEKYTYKCENPGGTILYKSSTYLHGFAVK